MFYCQIQIDKLEKIRHIVNMKKYKSHITGENGEDEACRFLRRNGYSIVARNYKSKIGELDVIAVKRATLVFVEVKTRSSNWMAMPYEFVDSRKQRKLKQLADGFLAYGGVDNLTKQFRNVRFDVIAVNMNEEGLISEIEHVKDAFE
jgi:putative endonuclease